ncbi:phosphomannomutase/phosphoglucomutase [candidate division WWE3 bacterium]|uniref:Phosphomannomutase/phosphoglucomutase n=1 Tax=candidate division WWE3 bacterium TaxID=2053526 RepID=A0A955LII7_UNCKA|nr:phosphomannomutase/phosphoglucomutase [candidate division WWE3 bacterium]
MNEKIFRAYDIRGLIGVDLEPQDALLIGKGFGTYIQHQFDGNRVVVGHDNRYSSPQLNDYFIQGVMSTGCKVTDIGLAITPLVHYAVIKHQFDAGCIITASHNPKEYNGFRFDGPNCHPIYNDALQEIRRIIEQNDFIQGNGDIDYMEIFDMYANDISKRINIQRKLKVVIDCGNGAASEFAPRLYESLGVDVIQQHCVLHGDFPYHTADPEQKINMSDSIMRVGQEKADLAIGFDTDGDRFGIIDENGKMYANDLVLIPLAKDVIRRFPGSKVIFDVKSSYVLAEEIQKAGGEPVMIRTGHPYFRHAMTEDQKILIGGEVSSHTYIRDNYYGFDDGLFAGLRVLELLSQTHEPFSHFYKDVAETFSTEEIRLPVPDDQKFVVVNGVRKSFEHNWEVITIDGVRAKFGERAWALVRASNTSPYITVRFEAESEAKLKEIIEITSSRLQQYPVVDITNLSALI